MRRTIIAAIGAVSVAAVISGVAAASASAASPATVKPMEQFRGMSTSVPGTGLLNIIATGAFTAGGVDIITGQTTDTYKFPGGTVKISHPGGHSTQTVNSRTCLFKVSERGPYKITGGTGKYKHINGSGNGTLSIVAVLVRDSKGKCSLALRPAATQLLLNLHGPVKL